MEWLRDIIRSEETVWCDGCNEIIEAGYQVYERWGKYSEIRLCSLCFHATSSHENVIPL